MQTLCQLPSTFRASTGTSIKFPCINLTFCQLPSTALAFPEPSVNFCQLSVASAGASSNFCQLSGIRGTFRQILSTFRVAEGPSSNFPCIHRTFHRLLTTFHASMDILSTSVNFLWVCGTFCKLPLRRRDSRCGGGNSHAVELLLVRRRQPRAAEAKPVRPWDIL